MPSRDTNRDKWTGYDWQGRGDEWSIGWGSSRVLWFGTILPRIHFLLPARSLLEIAPGHGRVTEHLLEHCERYVGVDITPRCVEACRERFAGRPSATFVVNDGKSLDAVADGSIDTAISWDSLVHADPEALEGYARALAQKLVPGGRAFLHHSNLGAHFDPATGRLKVENAHWRDERMSAELMRRFALAAGLAVDGQQLAQWGSPATTDCFTWLRRPLDGEPAATAPAAAAAEGESESEALSTHPSFGAEIAQLGWLHRVPGRGRA